jgi:guanylate kinase
LLGDLYGTPMPTPPSGSDVLLEIEIQGAAQVKQRRPDAHVILIEPPSMETLEERLVGRGDHEEHIARRLASTAEELDRGRSLAETVIVNHTVDEAVDQILSYWRGSAQGGALKE